MPGYGVGPGGWQPAGFPRDHPSATATLVLGILSLVLGLSCYGVGLVLGPIAWVKGRRALADFDANPGMYSNRGLVNAGKICGIIATVLLCVGIIVAAMILVALVASDNPY